MIIVGSIVRSRKTCNRYVGDGLETVPLTGRPEGRPYRHRPFRSLHMSKFTGSKKATQFTESVIREMTRLNQMYGGVNLSQGFPDFPAPAVVKDAACAAIQADVNQYAVTWGTRSLREAIAREFGRRYGVTVVPD